MANEFEDKTGNTNLYEIYPDIDNKVPNAHKNDGIDGVKRTGKTDGFFGDSAGCRDNDGEDLVEVSEQEIIQDNDLVNPDENTLDRG
ncbi:MAG: hypothetical protein LIO79_08660 [Rikenellaceae bacterium]|nr:hypothetical protein [Rikenellaceae bacterium]